MSEQLLELKNIKKGFGETDVLNGITLSIEKGEFITFLGASGCGKTTTLRIIAGLEAPDSGTVFLDGKDVTAVPPNQRDVNTVFLHILYHAFDIICAYRISLCNLCFSIFIVLNIFLIDNIFALIVISE